MKPFVALGILAVIVTVLGALWWRYSDDRHAEKHQAGGPLVIYSTTDTAVIAPLLADFRRLHPEVELSYRLMDAEPMYHRFLREARDGQPVADLLLSSSMDLQAKLVNDGHAQPHVSLNSRAVPYWARWRDEAFGISFEPVVMVFNRDLMKDRDLPRSRTELLADLRRDPDFWRDRIGTYDITRSGVGYLLASQDARLNSESGMLIDSFGDVGVWIDENSAAILDRVEKGELVMGYNMLGSYARARIDAGAPLIMVYPQEYTLTLSRTALIPRTAPHAPAAHVFLEYLLSIRGQQVLASRSGLNAVRREIGGPYSDMGLSGTQVGPLRPIALGPGLLVYLDDRKHAEMIASWTAAIAPAPTPGESFSGY